MYRIRPDTGYILHILNTPRATPDPGTRAEYTGHGFDSHSRHTTRLDAFLIERESIGNLNYVGNIYILI